jgi:hypothetical protein
MIGGALLVLAAIPLPSQEMVTIPDEVTCTTCEIRTDLVTTLGGSIGDELLADMMGEAAARDASGAYWLFSYRINDVLWRFSSDGGVALVGAQGQGPREFLSIGALGATADGRLLAIDRGNSRVVTLGPRGVRSEVLYHSPGVALGNVVPLAGDTVLVATVSMGMERVGVPIHAVDITTGRAVGSLGSPVEQYQAQLTQRYQERRLSYMDGAVLAGHAWEYRLDLFDWPTRSLTESVVRDAPWFRPVDISTVRPPQTRPPPRMIGVRWQRDGTALVLIRRPRPDWLAAYDGDERRRPEGELVSIAEALVYETVLEHLDLEHAAVLARVVIPGAALAFVAGSDNQIAVLHDEELIPTVAIHQIVTVRKSDC